MKVVDYNRNAWDKQVEQGNMWTVPVTSEDVAAAQQGSWRIILTPTKAIPEHWYPQPLQGRDVLCLASGGGQQGPIMAAVGARVTVFDNSSKQLERDRMVAERDGLVIRTVQGDMADLSVFPNASFDLILHPVSNCFAQEVRPVWKEANRVLRPGGALLSGFNNPAVYMFDFDLMEQGILEVRYPRPYSDLVSLSEEKKQQYLKGGEPLEFGHSLDDQIGGQIDAGFVIAGFYEDIYPGEALTPYLPQFIATRAIKPEGTWPFQSTP